MKTLNHNILLAVLAVSVTSLLAPSGAHGQTFDFSVGPQISTLGVGISASARFSPKLGVSAEYNLFPIKETNKTAFDNSIVVEPALQGGLMMVTFHPSGGKFAIGGGIQTGGATADALLSFDSNSAAVIELGDNQYPTSGVGNLTGTFEYGSSVQPSVLLGWIGSGFNFALGASLATPTLELEASGPLKNDAQFRADLDKEIADFDDEAGQIPVFPYVRLGWQFSF